MYFGQSLLEAFVAPAKQVTPSQFIVRKTQALASRLLYDHEHPPCPCSFSSKSRRLAPTRTQHHSTRVCGVLVHKEAPTEPPKGQPSSPQGPGTSSRHFMDA